jgi:hypothetical protein
LGVAGPPPDAVLDALSRHKADVVRIWHSANDRCSPEYWHVLFHERAAFAELAGGLTRSDAEAQAFESCIVEWLNRNPAPSVAGGCTWCRQSESQGAVVVPYGTEPGTHAWLHPECWPAWHELRRSRAREALARMGISADACSVSGAGSPSVKEAPQQLRTQYV